MKTGVKQKMKNKKLVWRLSKLPTIEEITTLIKEKIITQEEAREILFNQEAEEDRDKSSLESEIKFLRELVEKLSNDKSRIVEVIKEVKVPYYQNPWYQHYWVWCSGDSYNTAAFSKASNATALGSISLANNVSSNFSDIKTF